MLLGFGLFWAFKDRINRKEEGWESKKRGRREGRRRKGKKGKNCSEKDKNGWRMDGGRKEGKKGQRKN